MIRLKTVAIMASIMVTTTVTACAGDLTAVRVSDYDGASRIVFDMTELPLSWTKSYNANQNTVTLNLANTTNKISNAADRTTHKIGVLKGMSFQPTNDGLQVRLIIMLSPYQIPIVWLLICFQITVRRQRKV